jgi:hypothetical protein
MHVSIKGSTTPITSLTRLPIDPITVGRRWGQRHPQGANSGSIGRLDSKPSLKQGCHQPTLIPCQPMHVRPAHFDLPYTACTTPYRTMRAQRSTALATIPSLHQGSSDLPVLLTGTFGCAIWTVGRTLVLSPSTYKTNAPESYSSAWPLQANQFRPTAKQE